MLGYIIHQSIIKKIQTPQGLAKIKREGSLKFKQKIPTNIQLLKVYHDLLKNGKLKRNPQLEKILKTREIRTSSGVAIITVLTKPWSCPGRCLYCPDEPDMPKSYLKNEPAAQRAYLNKFDPYKQAKMRLEALKMTGHSTDKIELIVLGGTWSAYPKNYQYWFIKECFRAANATSSKNPPQPSFKKEGDSSLYKREDGRDFESAPSLILREGRGELKKILKHEQRKNETAKHRIIGLTLETRPDYITIDEIKQMRDLGCTRVELGVQSLYDDILKKNLRGHDVAATIRATRLLKDAGFKVNYHMMLNLPGSTLARDEKMFRELFSNPDFQPDLLKIYPCVVLRTAPLYKFWKQGKYKPYTEKQLINLILRIKQKIPPYVRIQRIIRDIPGQSIIAGSKLTNLRQIIHNQFSSPPQLRGRKRGGGVQKFINTPPYPSPHLMGGSQPLCRCIRCREIRGQYSPKDKIKLFRQDYLTSGGKEIFLSFEDKKQEKLYALLRLRIPSANLNAPQPPLKIRGGDPFLKEGGVEGEFSPSLFQREREGRGELNSEILPVLHHAALIRELHTFGQLAPLTKNYKLKTKNYAQHTGLGKKLMTEAERIAKKEFGLNKVAVISGIGVRQYYKNLGYKLKDEYMVKNI